MRLLPIRPVPQVEPKGEVAHALSEEHAAIHVPLPLQVIPDGQETVLSHPNGVHWPLVILQVPPTDAQSASELHVFGTQFPAVQALPVAQLPSTGH